MVRLHANLLRGCSDDLERLRLCNNRCKYIRVLEFRPRFSLSDVTGRSRSAGDSKEEEGLQRKRASQMTCTVVGFPSDPRNNKKEGL